MAGESRSLWRVEDWAESTRRVNAHLSRSHGRRHGAHKRDCRGKWRICAAVSLRAMSGPGRWMRHSAVHMRREVCRSLGNTGLGAEAGTHPTRTSPSTTKYCRRSELSAPADRADCIAPECEVEARWVRSQQAGPAAFRAVSARHRILTWPERKHAVRRSTAYVQVRSLLLRTASTHSGAMISVSAASRSVFNRSPSVFTIANLLLLVPSRLRPSACVRPALTDPLPQIPDRVSTNSDLA